MPRKTVFFCFVLCISILNIHAQEARPDSYEADSRTARVPIQGGVWISRTIHSGDEDWFTFTPEAAGILVAETAGDIDTVMELYDGVSMVAENDDGDNNDEDDYSSRIEYFAEAGVTYTIKVSGYDKNETGPYRFRTSLEPIIDNTEPNDTMTQAYSVELENVITAYFHPANDTDWYRIRVPSSGILIVHTTGFTDTVLSVYDSGKKLLAEDDDSGDEDNARIYTEVSAGTVYVKVSEYDNRIGKYYLHVRFREPVQPDQFENDDTLGAAKEIQPGSSQERNFTNDSDKDWVRLVITRPGTYEIRAEAADDMLDTFLVLTNEDGEELLEDDDSGGDLDACITAELVPGTYYINVTTLDEDPLEDNVYTLSVSAAR